MKEKEQILEDIYKLQLTTKGKHFKNQDKHDLFLRELIADYISGKNDLLIFLEWYLKNRYNFNSAEPKFMVKKYLNK